VRFLVTARSARRTSFGARSLRLGPVRREAPAKRSADNLDTRPVFHLIARMQDDELSWNDAVRDLGRIAACRASADDPWGALASVSGVQGIAVAGWADDERRAMRHAEALLSRVVAAGQRPPRARLEWGTPAQVFMDVARELGADLVVVGSGDRSSEVGPVAELVALTAPVLVVKCPIGAHRELGPFGPDAPR